VKSEKSPDAQPDTDTDRPADVLHEEWRDHKAIMQAIREWKLEHAEDEPFLDPEELRDPRVRRWREIMSCVHSSGWGKWPKSNVADVKTVGEILSEHPIIQKLIE
jgi:hypothetical protein